MKRFRLGQRIHLNAHNKCVLFYVHDNISLTLYSCYNFIYQLIALLIKFPII